MAVATKKLVCPKCGNRVEEITQSPNSPLNRHQFDAAKAGDYFCRSCLSNDRGNSPYCYWWEKELPDITDNYAI